MKKTALIAVLLTPSLIASGCSSTPDGYPSLAIREVERVNTQMNPPSSQSWVAPQLDQEALTNIPSLMREAQASHTAFLESARNMSGSIESASGTKVGSEEWSIAQIALAELGSKRNGALIALADLDRIYVAASTAGEELGQIAPAQRQVEQMIAEENQIIDALVAKLN